MSDLSSNFEFRLEDSFPGYDSAADQTNLASVWLVKGSQNVYRKISGTIAARPGLLRRGSADNTIAGVKSSTEWETSLGATRVIRVANNKLQVESDVVTTGTYVWYDLVLTSTLVNPAATLTRFIFDAWWDNTEKKDRLLMVRGDSNILHWSGGLCTVASGTANTITKLDSTKTWAQEGFATNTAGEKKIVINGTEYTYTGGETTQTLTGVSPTAAGLSSGQVAVQSVIIESSEPAAGFNADFLKTIGNQVFVGSYTSRLIYISADDSFTNYTVPTPRTPGDPELLTLDNTAKGISVRKGNAHIGAGRADWYSVQFNDLTVGSTLTQQTAVSKQEVADLSAPYAHEFIDTVGDDIVYLAQDQQLRILGDFRNLFQPRYPLLSQQLQTELALEDFTGGHLRCIGDTTYITAPNSGKDYMYQVRDIIDESGNITAQRIWHPPQVRNIARFASIDGVTYGHSNANPQIYQVWDTEQWHDDSPSNEALPYTCVARFAYQQLISFVHHRKFNRRQGLQQFDKVYSEGYISTGTDLTLNIYGDYQGSTSSQSVTVSSAGSPATFFSGISAPSLGDSSLGVNELGDDYGEETTSQDQLPKFRVINDVNPTDVFEYQLEYISDSVDSRWELLACGTNAVMDEDNQAVFIRK
jgi:hypothetical protein